MTAPSACNPPLPRWWNKAARRHCDCSSGIPSGWSNATTSARPFNLPREIAPPLPKFSVSAARASTRNLRSTRWRAIQRKLRTTTNNQKDAREAAVLTRTVASPAFGKADLSNCEREQIHLAGCIQPHGAVLLLREPDHIIVQASDNAAAFLGLHRDLIGQRLEAIVGDLARKL